MPGFINNAHDRANLNFLLTLDNEALKTWYKTCSTDDILYAKSLLDALALEMEEEMKESIIEVTLNSMDHFIEANAVLSYIREKQ